LISDNEPEELSTDQIRSVIGQIRSDQVRYDTISNLMLLCHRKYKTFNLPLSVLL